MRKLLSVLLALTMLFGTVATTSFAAPSAMANVEVAAEEAKMIADAAETKEEAELTGQAPADADIWDGTVDTSWYDAENPQTEYTLTTAEQLAGFAKLVDDWAEYDQEEEAYLAFSGVTINLGANIDLDNVLFNPIGSYRNDKAFCGTFNGNGYTISNLSQNTWDLDTGYYYSDLGLGLFALVYNATIKDLTVDGADISGESAMCGTIAAAAFGDSVFENIIIKNANVADYQYYAGGIVGWASGDHQFIGCRVEETTTVAGQWGDFDNSIGGIIGGCGGSATVLMKDCYVACRIDAYNDVTSSYQWYAYRRAGMLIGNTNKTQDLNGTTYAVAPQITVDNCTVVFGDWSNYTYCEFAGTSWPWVRVQAGISNSAYSNPRYGHPVDADGNEVVDDNHVHNDGEGHFEKIKFNQFFGGGQGVYGPNLKALEDLGFFDGEKNSKEDLIVKDTSGVVFVYAPEASLMAVQSVPGYIFVNSFETLEDALEAANDGDMIVLNGDIVLEDTVVVEKTVILDLNGHTISQEKEQTAGYQMILNDGNLTINDSVGTGKISYTDIGNGGDYISDTIYNRGTLVINGGTIENLSSATVASNGFPHAVDTYSGIRDTSVTINGGTIYCAEYSAIRMFCVSATNTADLVINGGTVKGAVDMQNGTIAEANGSLTITGGDFETTANANNIRFANWNGGATEYGIEAEIKGGTFDGGITTAYVPAGSAWEGKIISGGTFVTAPSDDLIADGFAPVTAPDGTVIIIEDRTITLVASSETVKTNEEFTISVILGGAETKAVRWELTYDDTCFDLVSVTTDYINYGTDALKPEIIAKNGNFIQSDAIATYTFKSKNEAVVDSRFEVSNVDIRTDVDVWLETDVTAAIVISNTDVTVELRKFEDVEVKYDNAVIDVTTTTKVNDCYDDADHKFEVTTSTTDATLEIAYTVNGGSETTTAPVIKQEGEYEITYTITADGYETVTGTVTVVMAEPVYVVEVATGADSDYVHGAKLVLVYTNVETGVTFDYDSVQMFDVTAKGYKYNGTETYAKVYALVVDAFDASQFADENEEFEAYDELVAVDYEDAATEIDYDPAEDVNFSGTVTWNDITAAYTVLEKNEYAFKNQMAGFIKADVNGDKKMTTGDVSAIVGKVYPNTTNA